MNIILKSLGIFRDETWVFVDGKVDKDIKVTIDMHLQAEPCQEDCDLINSMSFWPHYLLLTNVSVCI